MPSRSFQTLKKQKAIQCFNENKLDEAEKYLKQVCQKAKMDAESWYLLGLVHGRKANHAEAEKCFRRVLQIAPDVQEACINLAVSLNIQAKYEECTQLLETFLKQHPNNVDALLNLSIALLALKKPEQAVAHASQALKIANSNPTIHETLASAYAMLEMTEKAREHFEKAIKLDDRNLDILSKYAKFALLGNDLQHCISLCKKILSIDNLHSSAHNTLFSALVSSGRIKEALASENDLMRLNPATLKDRTGYLLTLNYDEDLDPGFIRDEHQRWGEAVSCSPPENKQHQKNRPCNKPVRIGYVSPDFRMHSVAYFLEPLLKHHDRNTFEVFCYSNVRNEDAVTERFKSYVQHWRDINRMDDKQVVKQIRKDKIDILVDLAGHTSRSRIMVFAAKPAPVQITYLGYPATTGLPEMDYRVVDENTDPVEFDGFTTEKLLRVPGCFLCYSNSFTCEPDQAEHTGPVVYGSFNNLPKINARVVETWARILNRVPGSKLLLKSKTFADSHVSERYLKMFEEHGIDPGRITLMGKIKDEVEHLQCYNRIDIALDTFPYNGTTTTCEALLMGVPVITFTGDRHAARVSSSILKAAGLDELVAEDTSDYIDKAVSLAEDPARRQQYRANLRRKMLASPLCDEASFTQKFEKIYLAICDQGIV